MWTLTPSRKRSRQVRSSCAAGAAGTWSHLESVALLLFVGFFVWIGRRGRALGGGIAGAGRSKARVYDHDDRPSTRFDDVAGYQGAKQEVTEVVDFVNHPGKYQRAPPDLCMVA